jgi:hypothetical protein
MLGISIRCCCSCYHCKYYNLTSLCLMFHIFFDGISRIRWTILAEFWQLSSKEETCLYINNKHKEHVCMLKRLRGLFICEASFWSFCKRWENTSNKTPKIDKNSKRNNLSDIIKHCHLCQVINTNLRRYMYKWRNVVNCCQLLWKISQSRHCLYEICFHWNSFDINNIYMTVQ